MSQLLGSCKLNTGISSEERGCAPSAGPSLGRGICEAQQLLRREEEGKREQTGPDLSPAVL